MIERSTGGEGETGWRIPEQGRDGWRLVHFFTGHATRRTACGRGSLTPGRVDTLNRARCMQCQEGKPNEEDIAAFDEVARRAGREWMAAVRRGVALAGRWWTR